MPDKEWRSRAHSAEKVAAYYDEVTDDYLDIYGEIIQAYRPADDEELLKYMAESAGLKAGMRILDAGCGVGKPAMFFASLMDLEVEGVTVSGRQVEEAEQRIARAGLEQRIRVQKGDFHFLDKLYEPASFDRVLFLESLGHATEAKQVIRAAHTVLKDGGYIYIKDFFVRESDDPEVQARMNKVMENINTHYAYNVLDLHNTLSALRRSGFHLDLIRRMQFEPDVSIRTAFEDHFGIDLYDGKGEFMAAEWFEVRCQKLGW